MGYTKLFNEIIMSTVWREPNHIRILWITMLALKDQYHTINASLPGLADAARITIKECEEALKVLSEPDPHSRTKEFSGRRIESCDGGWLILNGEKYRNKMSADERREYKRIKQRGYRKQQKEQDASGQSSGQNGHLLTHTEEEAKEEKERRSNPLSCKQDNVSVQAVFKSWQTVLNHHRSVLDNKRTTKIKQALKNYTIEELTQAFWGCKKSPFHMGDNDRNQKYDDITLILRDAEHIERFISYIDKPPSAQKKPFNPAEDSRPRKPLS